MQMSSSRHCLRRDKRKVMARLGPDKLKFKKRSLQNLQVILLSSFTNCRSVRNEYQTFHGSEANSVRHLDNRAFLLTSVGTRQQLVIFKSQSGLQIRDSLVT